MKLKQLIKSLRELGKKHPRLLNRPIYFKTCPADPVNQKVKVGVIEVFGGNKKCLIEEIDENDSKNATEHYIRIRNQ